MVGVYCKRAQWVRSCDTEVKFQAGGKFLAGMNGGVWGESRDTTRNLNVESVEDAFSEGVLLLPVLRQRQKLLDELYFSGCVYGVCGTVKVVELPSEGGIWEDGDEGGVEREEMVMGAFEIDFDMEVGGYGLVGWLQVYDDISTILFFYLYQCRECCWRFYFRGLKKREVFKPIGVGMPKEYGQCLQCCTLVKSVVDCNCQHSDGGYEGLRGVN